MKSSNPVLSHLDETAAAQRRADVSTYGQPQYAGPTQYGPYGQPPVISTAETGRTMTLDDVVIRTVGLVALVILTAAASWVLLKTNSGVATAFMIGASLAGIALVFVISFKRVTNPAIISLYAILQGVLLGVVSREFEHAYPGIVVQAVAGTLAVFFGMALLYKFRVIRATPRFARWVMGALIGVVGISLINWLLSLFGHNLGFQYYSRPTKVARWPSSSRSSASGSAR